MASGQTVGASDAFVRWLKSKRDRSYLALEMEAAGVMAAVASVVDVARSFVLRVASDCGDERKKAIDAIAGGAFRKYAMRNGIEFLWLMMDEGGFGQPDLCGESIPGSTPEATSSLQGGIPGSSEPSQEAGDSVPCSMAATIEIPSIMLALAREYDLTRQKVPSGMARTAKLIEISEKMRRAAVRGAYQVSLARAMFSEGGEGLRIAALCVGEAANDRDVLDLVSDAIRQSKSAFEQSTALRFAEKIVADARRPQQAALKIALEEQLGDGAGAYLRDATDNRKPIAMRLLARLKESGI